MIQSIDGRNVYLVIPKEYADVYKELLKKISDVGYNILNDCKAICKGNRNVISCWILFNSACAAYALGETKKANLMINYIICQLRLNTPKVSNEENLNYPEGEINDKTIWEFDDNYKLPKPKPSNPNKPILPYPNHPTYPFDDTVDDNPGSDPNNGDLSNNDNPTPGPGPGPTPNPDPPVYNKPNITNFRVEVTNNKHGHNATINKVYFNIDHVENVKPNSVNLKFINKDKYLFTNENTNSPKTLNEEFLVNEGTKYQFQLSLTDTKGNVHYSNIFEITGLADDIKRSVVYYGITDMNPVDFLNKDVDFIYKLPNKIPVEITGNDNNNFIINQSKTIHYLIIPDDIDFIKSQYGDVLVSVIYDKYNPDENMYREPKQENNSHDGKLWKVYFYYTPSSFEEDITITMKNK